MSAKQISTYLCHHRKSISLFIISFIVSVKDFAFLTLAIFQVH